MAVVAVTEKRKGKGRRTEEGKERQKDVSIRNFYKASA